MCVCSTSTSPHPHPGGHVTSMILRIFNWSRSRRRAPHFNIQRDAIRFFFGVHNKRSIISACSNIVKLSFLDLFLYFSPAHVECLPACFPGGSCRLQSLSCQQLSNPRHENINFAVNGSNRTRALVAAGASALFSVSIVSSYFLRPLSACAHTLPAARLHPVQTSFCLSDTETQPEWQKPKHLSV